MNKNNSLAKKDPIIIHSVILLTIFFPFISYFEIDVAAPPLLIDTDRSAFGPSKLSASLSPPRFLKVLSRYFILSLGRLDDVADRDPIAS